MADFTAQEVVPEPGEPLQVSVAPLGPCLMAYLEYRLGEIDWPE